jgi:hypothetical protein
LSLVAEQIAAAKPRSRSVPRPQRRAGGMRKAYSPPRSLVGFAPAG